MHIAVDFELLFSNQLLTNALLKDTSPESLDKQVTGLLNNEACIKSCLNLNLLAVLSNIENRLIKIIYKPEHLWTVEKVKDWISKNLPELSKWTFFVLFDSTINYTLEFKVRADVFVTNNSILAAQITRGIAGGIIKTLLIKDSLSIEEYVNALTPFAV